MKKPLMTVGLIVGLLLSAQTASAQYVYEYIYGRVTTANGVGVSNVTISAPPGTCSGFPGASAQTSTFGYYALSIPFDCTIIIIPQHRKYTFTPSSVILNLGTYDPVNFVAAEN